VAGLREPARGARSWRRQAGCASPASAVACAMRAWVRNRFIPDSAARDDSRPLSPEEHELRRREMVALIKSRGITDTKVLNAMLRVPRHEFVEADTLAEAYEDGPLAIGFGQTISQPYIVALMTELAELPQNARVLEVGTGSGYQTAVLAEVGAEVFSLEIVPELADRAEGRLARRGYSNVHVLNLDAFNGYAPAAPYDAILCAAAPVVVPRALQDQLKVGGRLIVPVGADVQELIVVERTIQGFQTKSLLTVRFVPMTGKARES
jgi:protein-L-isoaspartate(D-aspartate) O-methyltransferase